MLHIIIPFYKNEDLVSNLIGSLITVKDEIVALGAHVIAVNDSPDYPPLASALAKAAALIGDSFPFRIDVNAENMGFVRSCNQAMSKSIELKCDFLLLNSDTYVFPGALTAILDVASKDPMIAFVSPRSNNATICNLPHDGIYNAADPHKAFSAYRLLADALPEYDYVPTVVGYCLFMRGRVLAEIGLFDEIYSPGYNEENDLIQRANRFGYCAAIANRGFVWHKSSQSFSTPTRDSLNERNAAILDSRYPEYEAVRKRYLAGSAYRGEAMLGSLLPDEQGRVDIGFNFLHFGCHYNGTFEAALNILRGMATLYAREFNFFVVVHEDVAKFHSIETIPNVQIVSPYSQRNFALYLLIGQPFTVANLADLSRRAPLICVMMMDTIALDCGYIEPERDLRSIWQFAFDHFDGMAFISHFSEAQFRRRFEFLSSMQALMCPLSLRLSDYRSQALPDDVNAPEPGYWFVVGNHFAHKAIPPTLKALCREFPDQRIVVLGVNSDLPPNVVGYQAGSVSEGLIEILYRRAAVVIFPSHYEGFGFPILKALSSDRPILVRNAQVSSEMIGHLQNNPNVVMFDSTKHLMALLRDKMPVWISGHPESIFGWDQCADEMAGLCRRMLKAGIDRGRISRRLTAIDRFLVPEIGGNGSVLRRRKLNQLHLFFKRHPHLRTIARPLWRLALWLRRKLAVL